MDNDWDFTADEGFGFMGRVNAGISHEMKNIMATISETAGLMEDWVDLAAKGRPLDMGRVEKLLSNHFGSNSKGIYHHQ